MRYQSTRPKRQFLAGVKCPSCGEIDKIVQVQIFEPAFDEYIECTECGHSESRPTSDDLPKTVNAINAMPNDEEVQPIKFLP